MVPPWIKDELDQANPEITLGQLFVFVSMAARTILKLLGLIGWQLRIALAFGQGDLSQKLAEHFGRIYSSTSFGTGDGYCGEARLHRRLNRTNLTLGCKITMCNIPVKVPAVDPENDNEVKLVEWPVLLPGDFAKALIDAGFGHLLWATEADRVFFLEPTTP